MADVDSPQNLVERGVVALRLRLGPDQQQLLRANKNSDPPTFELLLPEDFLGVVRKLIIGFLPGFPRSGLRLQIEPSPWLEWPHAMPSGVCLFGLRQRPTTATPEEVVDQSISRVAKLLELVVARADADARRREFEAEITSYWSHQLKSALHQVVVLTVPPVSQRLFVLSDVHRLEQRTDPLILLGTNARDLASYEERLTGVSRQVREPAEAAFFLHLHSFPPVRVPLPTGLSAWLAPHAETADLGAFDDWYAQSGAFSLRWLVLGLPNGRSTAMAAQVLVLKSAGLKKESARMYGRRAGRRQPPVYSRAPPAEIQFAASHILDRASVHSRDQSPEKDQVARARVAMVGCGTLGAAVALHLARTGVARLTLIDPDYLAGANLGRHVLGAEYLGRSKAISLRERLRRDVPTVDVVAQHKYFEEALASNSKLLDDCDVVIVTTADWPSESFLWELKRKGAPWCLIQAWSEPHGQIGHALLAPKGPFDARYLFEASGRFRHRISKWPEDGIVALPACGDSYIPAGPVSLAFIVAMVSSLAIDAISELASKTRWVTAIGEPDQIKKLGGQYDGPVLAEGTRYTQLDRSWPTDESP